MFKCQDYMTREQQIITEEFKKMVESEYALCVREIRKINKAIANNPAPDSPDGHSINCANLEIDSIQKYWQNRLGQLVAFIETKSIKINEELARKYLSNE